MTISGRENLSEGAAYIKSAGQKRLARSAMETIGGTLIGKPRGQVRQSRQERGDFKSLQRRWQSLGESNPSSQIENLVS
jgi:hypothetical protein